MQYWNSVEIRPVKDLPFFGQMTLPRELNVKNGRLIQNPVRELETYRSGKVAYQNMTVNGRTEFPDVKGRCVDLTVSIRPDGSSVYKSFTVNIAEGNGYAATVCFSSETGTVLVDRSRAGWPDNILNMREFAVRDRNGEIKLRFILDRYSLELFVNDGEQAASFAIFSPGEADGISFESEGEVSIDIEQFTPDI